MPPLGDRPGAVVVLDDVLAGHEGQQTQRASCVGAFDDRVFEGVDKDQCIADQGVDQCCLGHRVIPGNEGLALGLVVVGDELDCSGPGDHPEHPTDGGDQLGDGVLSGHGVVEEGRIEGSASLALQDPGGIDDRAHGIEDALWALRGAQPCAPIGEHRIVEALVVEGQPAGHLPADSVA